MVCHKNNSQCSLKHYLLSPSSLSHKPATIKQLVRIFGGKNREFEKACLARLAIHDFLKHECGEGELLPAEEFKFGDCSAIEAVTHLFQPNTGDQTTLDMSRNIDEHGFLKQAAEKNNLCHTADNEISYQKINK